MSDERPVNPHTGEPVPADPAPPAVAARATVQGGGVPPDAAPGASGATPAAPSSAAPSQQEMAIRSALETVMDPEIGLSVIDLGLIREVLVGQGNTHIKMMLTTPFCPYAPQMMEDVQKATMGVVPLPCEVEIMPDAWSPQMMPDPGLLGFSF